MTNELTVTTGGQLPAVQQPALVPLAAILQAAQDPNTDLAKMEGLIALYERMQDRASKAQFNQAMVAAQAHMPRVMADGKVLNREKQVQSRYATYERITDQIAPILREHGLSYSVAFARMEGPSLVFRLTVRHTGGHVEHYESAPMPPDTSGNKNATQAPGSTEMYATRRTVCSVFGVVIEGKDLDGNQRQPEPLITQQQADDLQTLIESGGWNLEKTKVRIGGIIGAPLNTLKEIPAKHYQQILAALQSKGAK